MATVDCSVVALGGGHGLHASLSALRRVARDVTAVVTVADNGGSSGRLREQFDVLPPGDLRMALAALCGDDDWGQTWAEVLQHRFAGAGDMRGHAVGNLLIVGMWEQLGDAVAALDLVGRLLGARGRVLPMSTTPIDIAADVAGLVPGDPRALTRVRGQVEVATTAGRIDRVLLEPAPVPACPEAVAAVRRSDWVVLGPGSWYSSVIPHLLVPELRDAVVARGSRLVIVLNLETQQGETHGFAPEDHLAVLRELAPDLTAHSVVAHADTVADVDALEKAVLDLGGRLVVGDVSRGDGSAAHDPARLGRVLEGILGSEGR